MALIRGILKFIIVFLVVAFLGVVTLLSFVYMGWTTLRDLPPSIAAELGPILGKIKKETHSLKNSTTHVVQEQTPSSPPAPLSQEPPVKSSVPYFALHGWRMIEPPFPLPMTPRSLVPLYVSPDNRAIAFAEPLTITSLQDWIIAQPALVVVAQNDVPFTSGVLSLYIVQRKGMQGFSMLTLVQTTKGPYLAVLMSQQKEALRQYWPDFYESLVNLTTL
jgi:hypothetical protein